MLNNRIINIFFLLLKSGLWKNANLDTEFFPLTNREWEEIYKISINQTVECIVFDGIQKLEPKYQPSKILLLNWAVRVEKHAQRNERMNEIIIKLHSLFQEHQVNSILLKGQGLAKCYDNPARRVCGDIDLFFEDKNTYTKAFNIINEKGLEINSMPGFSSEYNFEGFEVEHHRNMFDIHNPFVQNKLEKIRLEEVNNFTTLNIENTKIQLPSALETIIQANSHILKHLLSYGIGIRQLCDSARIYAHYNQELRTSNLKEIYSSLGIKNWIDMLHLLLVKYLGLEESNLPYKLTANLDADWMMEDILVSGNFGFHNANFVDKEINLNGGRANKKSRIWKSFLKYVKVTPSEAIWFPIMQFYSRFKI
ncbi:nucleotidyltransferase domain-containing protein [Sphingobacterium sp. LZ4M12]|uniref:nucleotidyltransferase domain-containing protein n=1 Tax=Sphingobacterium sp. LZ4M12 TaxID=2961940 RepID=UPI0020C27C6D|nr:nucleotidyltransferase family protein [Sphingobacterium sp. LZ4M12]